MHADALRTGGLAAGSVVALYALWLNDRRRTVEECRQEIERERHELELVRAERERDRVTDERFAKSVELLGNEADQVRVGALHALAGLARNRPDYTQTVLDVICSYLRRPFDNTTDPQEDPEAQRELQVRLAAQRLIVDLLPRAGSEEPTFHLDLTGAVLSYFSPAGRRFGHLTMRYAKLYNSSNFSGCEFTGPAWFTKSATIDGRFICQDAVFGERAWFSGTEFGSLADFSGTRFAGEASFKDAVFAGDADFRDASFAASLDLLRARFDGHLDLRLAEMPKAVAFCNTMVNPQRDFPGLLFLLGTAELLKGGEEDAAGALGGQLFPQLGPGEDLAGLLREDLALQEGGVQLVADARRRARDARTATRQTRGPRRPMAPARPAPSIARLGMTP
jgi:pentapeptide repeat protein